MQKAFKSNLSGNKVVEEGGNVVINSQIDKIDSSLKDLITKMQDQSTVLDSLDQDLKYSYMGLNSRLAGICDKFNKKIEEKSEKVQVLQRAKTQLEQRQREQNTALEQREEEPLPT